MYFSMNLMFIDWLKFRLNEKCCHLIKLYIKIYNEKLPTDVSCMGLIISVINFI